MKKKKVEVVKQSDTSTGVIDTQPVCALLFSYSPEPRDIVFELTTNPNKIDVMQPGLLGTCRFGEMSEPEISLALWGTPTRDGARYYYSCALHDAAKKKEAWAKDRKTIPPLHKLHFYEFRKARPNDPDFATPECFIEAGAAWWGAMWVVLPEDPEALDQIRYFVVFGPKPFRQGLSARARENTEDSVSRLLERRKELELDSFYKAKQAQDRSQLDGEEIPGLE
jgi:hypothetical protein